MSCWVILNCIKTTKQSKQTLPNNLVGSVVETAEKYCSGGGLGSQQRQPLVHRVLGLARTRCQRQGLLLFFFVPQDPPVHRVCFKPHYTFTSLHCSLAFPTSPETSLQPPLSTSLSIGRHTWPLLLVTVVGTSTRPPSPASSALVLARFVAKMSFTATALPVLQDLYR